MVDMNITKPQAAPADHAVAVLLAQLLQRLDQSSEPVGAEQYRSVVRHLAAEFESLPTDATLSAKEICMLMPPSFWASDGSVWAGVKRGSGFDTPRR